MKQDMAAESARRQKLADLFLNMPPPDRQTAAERAEIRRALAELLQIEMDSVAAFAGRPRPLFAGDVAALMRAVGEAATVRLRSKGVLMETDIPAYPVWTSYEPRLLPLATALLCRAMSVRGCPLRLCLRVRFATVTVVVRAARPLQNAAVRLFVQETARAHGGRLLVDDRAAAFSLSHSTKKAVGEIISPTAAGLLQSPLSPVSIGLCAAKLPVFRP